MHGNNTVTIETFAERHFIKSFQKKYKQHWEITLRAIVAELERLDNFLQTDKAETIISTQNIKIIKTRFKIAGSNESAKTSGNRCIVSVDTNSLKVSVLLVYSKTDITLSNETNWWKSMIKDEYIELKDIITL